MNIEQKKRQQLPDIYKDVINYNMNLKALDYCSEPIDNIENFQLMINDKSLRHWDCHHRLEILKNKTAKQLKYEQQYYGRPASELIFLLPSDHMKLHQLANPNKHIVNYHKNKTHTDQDYNELICNRINDFKTILTYKIVSGIKTKNIFYNVYAKLYRMITTNTKNDIKKMDKSNAYLNLLSITSLNANQVKAIIGKDFHGKFIKRTPLFKKMQDIISKNNGSIIIHKQRIGISKCYFISYDKLVEIFQNDQLVNNILTISNAFYSKRQIRLINNQIINKQNDLF